MIKPKSRTKSSLPAFIEKNSTEELEPIYSKVLLLKKQLQSIKKQEDHVLKIEQQTFRKTWKQQFIEMQIDRDLEIQKQRKFRDTNYQLKNKDTNIKKKNMTSTTSTNWLDHKRNKTKSLINFLAQHKNLKPRDSIKTPIKIKLSESDTQENDKNDKFEPVGEQYKKQKLYQQSLKSQTQSLTSSRNQSIQSSLGIKKQSSKKYLRKGTRVRQILARQLQTPDERGSSASTLTYLKQYDQWVPSALVQEKKLQLENFMNIIYGEKKNKRAAAVNLDKLQLIYL